MKKVLIINASVRGERSQSRKLTQAFVGQWKTNYPDTIFSYREVGLETIPAVDENWIAAAFVKPENRTASNQAALSLSNRLLSELQEHDLYVIGTPMYNWSIPSGLKAYIDQIMRINETWKFRSGRPDGDYVGLLRNKKLLILSSRGDTGYEANGKNGHMNYQTTYLRFVFGIMGINDITVLSLDNEEFGGELFECSRKKIYAAIAQL